MNRDDLLKKCIDRGVADEASVEAVSHLFYMYLLTALQKGQRVEVPDFGTFGTRVVGVKHLRRMPYFEPDGDLADKVNERYRELKYLVVGRYELTPAAGQEEYAGKEAPHDGAVEDVGKEMLLDTHRDVTIEEYERNLALSRGGTDAKEKTMPKLNLKEGAPEEEMREIEETEAAVPPTLDEEEPARRGPNAIVQVLVALGLLALVTVALNYFGVIHLFGPGAPKVAEALPPPAETAPPQEQVQPAPETVEPQPPPASGGTVTPTPTPTPTPGKQPAAQPPAPAAQQPSPPAPQPVTPPAPTTPRGTTPAEPPSGARPSLPPSTPAGRWTVQVSSWQTMSKARAEVNRLTAAGFDAFISRAVVEGDTRFRVRVGRYQTEREAAQALQSLRTMIENGLWVARESAN